MKTILHISKYYSPFIGGIETVAKQLVTGLDKYKNVVICFSQDKYTHCDTIDGIEVTRVGVCASVSSQDIALGYFHQLRKLIHTYHPDAIHLHCPNPYVYPIVLMLIPSKTKLVVHWHSDILGKGLLYKLIKPLEYLLLRRANLILATSPNYVTSSPVLQQWGNKIAILPNVITPENFIPQPDDERRIKEIRNQWPNKILLFSFGRHVPYKGIDQLIEAEQWMLPNIQIIIAGSGPLTNEYKALATESSRIAFLDRLSTDELRCYLHAADIFAFPSINKAEAFGVALAEAMFCYCVPVVFHIEGSGVNWVNANNETGLEVPTGYIQEYAEAVNRLAKNESIRQRMAQSAHNRILELFTTSSFNQQINIFYKKILTNSKIRSKF